MLKKLKSSYQNNVENVKKFNALTNIAVSMFYLSVTLAIFMMVTVVFDVFVYSYSVDGGFISLWITYILITTAATLAWDYGKNNWGFLISLSVPVVQLLSGYYDYWHSVFSISFDEIFLDFQNGYVYLDGFLLYLANGAHLLGLVALVLGRPELQRLFRAR